MKSNLVRLALAARCAEGDLATHFAAERLDLGGVRELARVFRVERRRHRPGGHRELSARSELEGRCGWNHFDDLSSEGRSGQNCPWATY